MTDRHRDKLSKYAASQRVWYAADANESHKMKAWREQYSVLNELPFDDATKFAILEDHHKKLEATTIGRKYIEERATGVRQLLQKAGKTPKPFKISDQQNLDQLLSSLEDPKIRGVYESNRRNEVSQADLQQLLMSTEDRGRKDATIPLRPAQQSIEPFIQRVTDKSKDSGVRNDAPLGFRSGREELILQNLKAGKQSSAMTVESKVKPLNYGSVKKSLGSRVRSNFVPPVPRKPEILENSTKNVSESKDEEPTCSPPLANIDEKLIDIIKSEIMHKHKAIDWSDIAGLEYAKSTIMEAVVYPLMRPDIFTGLRRPPRGILLFGPPGTGKTLIGKCIASQSKSTFFSIKPSTLTSKWIGDGEKLVKALFAVAAEHQPAVVFMDEIDSLLSQRSESEHESSRRLKNEFLIQLDGATTSDEERILIVGATNRPQELDEAARRRFVRRLYIPLPEQKARIEILSKLLTTVCNNLNNAEIEEVANMTDGYSGADIDSLCREAAMEPIRAIPSSQIDNFNVSNVRPVSVEDFRVALRSIRPSVSPQDLKQYTDWNKVYGNLKP